MHPTAQIDAMHLRNHVEMEHKAKNRHIKSVAPIQFYKPVAILIIPENPLPGVGTAT